LTYVDLSIWNKRTPR